VYLFRLDANEKAEKILAQAVSNSHILALHRKTTYRNMSLFEDEMSRRLWACIYVLDRRVSLETGRPFLIQDVNADTDQPANLGDEWMQRQKHSTATREEMSSEIEMEVTTSPKTAIPYLCSMIMYSRVVGDVWKVVHCGDSVVQNGPNLVELYLEPTIEMAKKSLVDNLNYNSSVTFEDQFSGLEWWQIKQIILIHMVSFQGT
jgi:hypothetical protein